MAVLPTSVVEPEKLRGYVLTWGVGVMECGHLYVVSSALGGGIGVGSLQAGPHHGGGARRGHQVTQAHSQASYQTLRMGMASLQLHIAKGSH